MNKTDINGEVITPKNKTYQNYIFHNCTFDGLIEDVYFYKCDFTFCTFNCELNNVRFENGITSRTVFNDVVFREVTFSKVTFDWRTVFLNTRLDGATFEDECVFLNANLEGAILDNAKLGECVGDGVYMKSIVLGGFICTYTHNHLSIGCQSHPISKWREWKTTEGREWIRLMALEAEEWAEEYLDLVLEIIDKSPARNTLV